MNIVIDLIVKALKNNPIISICEVTDTHVDIDLVIANSEENSHTVRFSLETANDIFINYGMLADSQKTHEDKWFHFPAHEGLSFSDLDQIKPVIKDLFPEGHQALVNDFISTTFHAIYADNTVKTESNKPVFDIELYAFLNPTQQANTIQSCDSDAIEVLFEAAKKGVQGSHFSNNIYQQLLTNPLTPAHYLYDCLTLRETRKVASSTYFLEKIVIHPSFNESILLKIVEQLIATKSLGNQSIDLLTIICKSSSCTDLVISKITNYAINSNHVTNSLQFMATLALCHNATTETLELIINRTKLQTDSLEKPLRAHPNLSQSQLVKVNARFPNVAVGDLSIKNQEEVCIRYLKTLSEKEVFDIFRKVI
jgi:hypothetical protein